MGGNPFERASALSRAMRMGIPDVEVAKAAYVAGEIEIDELEELVGAALEGREVDFPVAMLQRIYAQRQLNVRFQVLGELWTPEVVRRSLDQT